MVEADTVCTVMESRNGTPREFKQYSMQNVPTNVGAQTTVEIAKKARTRVQQRLSEAENSSNDKLSVADGNKIAEQAIQEVLSELASGAHGLEPMSSPAERAPEATLATETDATPSLATRYVYALARTVSYCDLDRLTNQEVCDIAGLAPRGLASFETWRTTLGE